MAIAALLLAVNLGVYGDKALATATSLTRSINSWRGLNNSKEKYVAEIGKTLEVKDINLTLNEFFIGNSRIIFGLNINKGVNDAVKNHLKLIPDVYVNDKKVERSSDYVRYSVAQVDEKKEEYNIILEADGKDCPLNNKDEVKLVFSDLAKEYGVSDNKFTYSFVYDSTSYKNVSKEIKLDKSIIIGENVLSIGNVTVAPDRVLISGSSKGI